MNKRQKRGIILVSAGLVLVLCALGVHLIQRRQDEVAGQTAALLLYQLEEKTLPTPTQPEETEEADPALPEKEYMGYTLIGIISVPSVDIRLPVLNDWNEKMLKVAPCRYAGSLSGGNLIIMGHNYRSHFTPLQGIKVGAEVSFENAQGVVYHYRVAEIAYLHRTEGEKLPSEYPLTLFTCTPGGLERIVVRCEIA